MENQPDINFFMMALEFTAGLVIFIFAVTLLSDTLKAIAGDTVKEKLAKFTRNRWTGVLTGTVATMAVDSSSVTIIIVIALVNAGLLTFVQSLAVVMGSNIGTTLSSQLYAFDIDEYAPIAMFIGFLVQTLSKSEKWAKGGKILFAFGLIFFSLHLMGEAMQPLEQHTAFKNYIQQLDNPWLGVMIGAGVTVLIQSSSAMMGIVIVMASQGIIPLSVGISVMLGAEIGTCADTLIATIGREREAVRTGLFHLLFNITTVVLGVVFIDQLIALADTITPNASVERKIANAHVLFNVGGVLLLIGFVDGMARLLYFLIPQRERQLEPA